MSNYPKMHQLTIDEAISIQSNRPPPNSSEGQAWERGARWANGLEKRRIADLERQLEAANQTCTDAREQQLGGCFRAVRAERQLAESQSDLRKLKGWLWRYKGMESIDWIEAALGADATINREGDENEKIR